MSGKITATPAATARVWMQSPVIRPRVVMMPAIAPCRAAWARTKILSGRGEAKKK